MQEANAGSYRQRRNHCRDFPAMIGFAEFLTFPVGGFGKPAIDPMAETLAPRLPMDDRTFLALADAMSAEKHAFRPGNG